MNLAKEEIDGKEGGRDSLMEEKEAERREKKRRKRNERKRANKQKKEAAIAEERVRREQETARLELLEKTRAELEKVKAEQDGELATDEPDTKLKKTSIEPPKEPEMVLHPRKRPANPPFDPQDYLDQQPIETMGIVPLMLTQAPVYITLDDMEEVELHPENDNSDTSCFVYRISIENGGKDHPFREIFRFAGKRREDLDVTIEVSPIRVSRNHEDVLCLAGKPGRVSYSCKMEVSELRTPRGQRRVHVCVCVCVCVIILTL